MTGDKDKYVFCILRCLTWRDLVTDLYKRKISLSGGFGGKRHIASPLSIRHHTYLLALFNFNTIALQKSIEFRNLNTMRVKPHFDSTKGSGVNIKKSGVVHIKHRNLNLVNSNQKKFYSSSSREEGTGGGGNPKNPSNNNEEVLLSLPPLCDSVNELHSPVRFNNNEFVEKLVELLTDLDESYLYKCEYCLFSHTNSDDKKLIYCLPLDIGFETNVDWSTFEEDMLKFILLQENLVFF